MFKSENVYLEIYNFPSITIGLSWVSFRTCPRWHLHNKHRKILPWTMTFEWVLLSNSIHSGTNNYTFAVVHKHSCMEEYFGSLEYLYSKKLKCTLVQALRLCTGRTAQRKSRGIALLFHDHGIRRGWEVSVMPRPLFTPGKTQYPLYRRLGRPQGRFGQVR